MGEESYDYKTYVYLRFAGGVLVPILLLVIGVEAIVTSSTYWLQHEGGWVIGLGKIEALFARAIGISEVGCGVGMFGWFYAHETLGLNKYYALITGVGCIVGIFGALFAVSVQFGLVSV